jgi:hypothetical protein
MAGFDTTILSTAVTNRFYVIDRAMWAMSPYITDDEGAKIAIELERMAESKTEGNFTDSDAFNWLAMMLGGERYQAIQMMWHLDNQHNIEKLYAPEQLRDAYLHNITHTEGTLEEVAANPKNYTAIKVLKSEYK